MSQVIKGELKHKQNQTDTRTSKPKLKQKPLCEMVVILLNPVCLLVVYTNVRLALVL